MLGQGRLQTGRFRDRRGILFSFGLHHSDVLSSPLNETATLNYWVTEANFNSVSKMASRSEDVQIGRCSSNIVRRLGRECPSEDARCRALCFPNGVVRVLFCFMVLMDVDKVLCRSALLSAFQHFF
ncbi:hypothetical protein CEXT_262451 [Caerostris extrusa]|uniref:Uncharacterized protein n=1 Tax=Caerostris extrusa TaxID=172846 RepID=A0AAV4SCU8_CAEEX|nr:hypothetical protein CEXT_262451 [Caerostris extrusa]